jgi:pyrrolidone-carboxylate peptidase
MSTGKLQAQLKTLTAHGRKLTTDDVKKLVATAKNTGAVDASALSGLQNLTADAFAPGARENLQVLLGGMKAEAFVDLTTPRQTELGHAARTGASGITLRFEDGQGQLTQNSFWLEGKSTHGGPVELDLDGHKILVTARPKESAASVANRLSKLLPAGYEANVNSAFPDGRVAVQIFRKDKLPAALLQPVLDGRQPPIKVLITGYGKFGPYTTDASNPAWQMAQKLAQQKFPGAQIQAVLLPVEWSKVDDFARSVKQTYNPDVVISLGAGPHGLEVWAQNKTEGDDAAGVGRTGQPADPAGPDFASSTLPVDAIEAAERRAEDPSKGGTLGLHAPATGSRDERWAAAKQFQIDANNTYLCNYLNYRMLQTTRNTGIMCGFVHVDETTAPQELEVVIEQSIRAQLEKRAAQPAPSV